MQRIADISNFNFKKFRFLFVLIYMSFLTVILTVSLLVPLINCQVTSIGNYQSLISFNEKLQSVYQLPQLDNRKLEKKHSGRRHGIHTFGKTIPVSIDMSDFGTWSINRLGSNDYVNIWTLKIQSPNSLTLNILFDKFHLSSSAELYLVDESNVCKS